MTRFLWWGTAS